MQALLTLALLTAIPLVLGFPSGAPVSACVHLTPSHGADPQDGPSLFSIEVNADTYHPGEYIEGNVCVY